MKNIIQILHEGEFACVICNQDKIRTFSQPGVADLYYLLNNEPDFLKGAYVADKIVGKAAAALMILGGVNKLYTDIISQPALVLLQGSDIEVSYKESVPHVINRDKSDWCPMEKLCFQETSADSILSLITGFINASKKKMA
jgi:hypothetical protein